MIIFLYGEDTYRSRKKLLKIMERFTREVDPSGMNLVRFQGKGLTAEELHTALRASPFFVKRRMVVVENYLAEGKDKNVEEVIRAFFTDGKGKDDTVLVVWEGKGLGGGGRRARAARASAKRNARGKSGASSRAKLWKLLSQGEYAQEFLPLSEAEVIRWVTANVRAKGGAITPRAVRALAATCGNDLWRADGEIIKLSHFAGRKTITEEMVRELVVGSIEGDIFALVEAVASGNRAQSLQLIRQAFVSGMEPPYLTAMLTWQFRNVVIAKSGSSTSTVSPFVLAKAKRLAERFSEDDLRTIYERLLELDRALKHTSPGINPELFFDLFALKLASLKI